MIQFSSIRIIAGCLLLCLLVISCATPTAPTGGPPDREGPEVLSTEPETGTTNFSGRSIKFSFSEFVKRNTLQQALTIEPDLGIEYSINWGRKSVAIEFEERLPDSTTIIVTLGTDLADVNGNKISSPKKVAVSTGPEIDSGEIYGRVVSARTGRGESGHRILLYRTPADLSTKAIYSAETDTSGRFQFSYLSEGTYKAFWLNDRNRNKIWEPERERAQPFPRDRLELLKGATDTLETLYVANADTTAPNLQGVGLFSSRRLRLRFSENIEWTNRSQVQVQDSLGNRYADAYPLYRVPEERYILFVQSGQPLREGTTYRLALSSVQDEAGNILDHQEMEFTGSAQEDTTRQRIIQPVHPDGIFPAEPLEMIYAAPIQSTVIRDSLKVVEGTSLFNQWPNAGVDRNRLLVGPNPRWKPGIDYEIRVWNPFFEDYRSIKPTIWHPRDLGALNIIISDTMDTRKHRLRVVSAVRGVIADTLFSRSVEVESIPPLNYKLIVFYDANGNGMWDHGTVDPFRPPEPYFIQTNVPVEKRFTSDVTVDL